MNLKKTIGALICALVLSSCDFEAAKKSLPTDEQRAINLNSERVEVPSDEERGQRFSVLKAITSLFSD